MSPPAPASFGVMLWDVIRGVCPRCREGGLYRAFATLRDRCERCDYDFHPEPGFYLGAMMMPYFFSAAVTVPAGVYFKLSGTEMPALLIKIAVVYFVALLFLLYYARPVWLHLEHRISDRIRRGERDRGPGSSS